VKFELISLTVGMRRKVRSADEEIARVAGGQHGVITRRQLLAAGLDGAAVRRREAKGLLHRVHRGVYRVGHRAPSLEARYLAAVLACGEGAVLSGLAAAHLFGLVRGWLPPAEISSHSHRRVPGIAARRVRLDRQDVTVYRGIPITTVPRTVVDLAARLGPAELARACHEAEVRHGVRAAAAQAALARRPTARGAAKLRGDLHWRCEGHPELPRARFPYPAQRGLAPAPGNEQEGRRPPRRLPLARAPADG
jgi:predicted transcriptional regulator of viral defense system